MRMLRKRQRVDSHANEVRTSGGAGRRRISRYVYLALVAGMALVGLDLAIGHRVQLRAEGVVLQDRTDIAAGSIVRVEDVLVRPGDRITAGTVVLRVASAEILNALSEQSARAAALAQRETELRVRMRTAAELLPLARSEADRTSAELATLAAARKRGLVGAARHDAALAASIAARSTAIRFTIDQEMLAAELENLSAARLNAETALRNLENHYSGGEIRAGADGTVGPSVPAPGAVFRPGEPMLRVFGGRSYVLAYLPRGYLFGIPTGAAVTVSDGRHSAPGHIERLLPVSTPLPAEFRTAFQPGQSRQLARVALPADAVFPSEAQVRITAPISDRILGAGSWVARLFGTPTPGAATAAPALPLAPDGPHAPAP